MLGLIEADLAASRKNDRGQAAPAFFFYLTTLHLLRSQRFHRRLQVVAHKVKLVQVVLLGGMKSRLGRRQRKNQPPVTSINGGKVEDIAEESAVGVRIFAGENDVGPGDHRRLLLASLNGEHLSPSATAAQSPAAESRSSLRR